MKWWRQVSDSEFLERVQGQTRWIRRLGIAYVVGGILLGSIAGILVLEKLVTGFWQMFDDPSEQAAFQLGVISGFALAAVILMSGLFVYLGLELCLENRKDRLLIAYHQRLCALGELPAKPEDETN